jgi:hypothetical protein
MNLQNEPVKNKNAPSECVWKERNKIWIKPMITASGLEKIFE